MNKTTTGPTGADKAPFYKTPPATRTLPHGNPPASPPAVNPHPPQPGNAITEELPPTLPIR
jgi:hypothetical protein